MSDPLERHPSFSVVRRLAVGGMGEVLLTRFIGNAHVTPGLVVVKRTIPDHPNRGHQDEMLREEGRVALRLRHANLVDTYAVDELENHPLLVMEYLAGRSMAQVLGAAKRRNQPVPVPVALAVLRGSACGLHFAHTLREGETPLGLVHRDVSPANIFATFDGKVKVIDFGVAKADDSEIKTSTGILKGKLGYMSPEHAKGEKLDPRSDLWSLGVVFWEMLVADRLFGGQNPAMTLYQITQGQVESPRARRPDIPEPVERLCMRLLTKDREQRIGSGAELMHEIERLPQEMWQSADVGGFLADRFPAEADAGLREAADVARLTNPRPVPEGIVDAGGSSDQGEVATLIVDGQSLLQQAIATGALDPEVLKRRGRVEAEAPVDEQARTVAMSLDDVPDLEDLEHGEAPAPQAELPTVELQPGQAKNLSSPPETPRAQLTGQGALGNPSRPSGPPQPSSLRPSVPPAATPQSRPAMRQSGPMPAAPSRERASGPTPAAGGRGQPAASMPAPPPAPAPAAPTRSRANRVAKPGSRRGGPSAISVALSTFGALAVAMGLVFAFVTERRETAPLFVGYATADGTDAVVARAEDVPAGEVQPFQVSLANPQLALEPAAARQAVTPEILERALKASGVYARAQLPKTPRQRVAAALPVAIALLGLLSLAIALPGLLMQAGSTQLAMRVGLIASTLAGAAALIQLGGLGWPGLASLEEPDEIPRLTFTVTPAELARHKVPEDKRAELAAALMKARAALLGGKPQAAIDVLAPIADPKSEVPAMFRLLADAHRDLGKHSLAEGHYLRYLQLADEDVERRSIEAYLKTLQGQ